MAVRDATIGRATELVEFLMDGPVDRETIMGELGVDFATFRQTLSVARRYVCPQHSMAIPRPVAEDGYQYRLTADWISEDDPAIQHGARAITKDARTRVETLVRDLTVAESHLDGRSADGRRVRDYRRVMEGTATSLAMVDDQLSIVNNAA